MFKELYRFFLVKLSSLCNLVCDLVCYQITFKQNYSIVYFQSSNVVQGINDFQSKIQAWPKTSNYSI